MANPSGLGWRERFLGTVGQIGHDIQHNVSAVTGVFAYLEVTDSLIMPGGGVMDPEVWELLVDAVAPNENVVRMNYTDNPNITPADSFDYVFNAEGTEDAVATNTTRAFFVGNAASGGTGSFRAGTAAFTEWDAGNRGDNSAAFGLNNTALGAQSFACGESNQVLAPNASAVGGTGCAVGGAASQGSFVAGSDSSTLIGDFSSIVGGSNLNILGPAAFIPTTSALVGGTSNTIGGTIDTAAGADNVICGGQGNEIGTQNTANDSPVGCFIGGGLNNIVAVFTGGVTSECAIIGGRNNILQDTSSYSVIVGSDDSAIINSFGSAVIGGFNSSVANATYAVTVGGDSAQCDDREQVALGGLNVRPRGRGTAAAQRLQVDQDVRFRFRDASPGVGWNLDDRIVQFTAVATPTQLVPPPLIVEHDGMDIYFRNNAAPASGFTLDASGGGAITVVGNNIIPEQSTGHYVYEFGSNSLICLGVYAS